MFYMETKYGNHFGFYEGSLLDAFKNQTSYTYPAKLATEFFETILETSVKKKKPTFGPM
jgi:hypothetical protein